MDNTDASCHMTNGQWKPFEVCLHFYNADFHVIGQVNTFFVSCRPSQCMSIVQFFYFLQKKIYFFLYRRFDTLREILQNPNIFYLPEMYLQSAITFKVVSLKNEEPFRTSSRNPFLVTPTQIP